MERNIIKDSVFGFAIGDAMGVIHLLNIKNMCWW